MSTMAGSSRLPRQERRAQLLDAAREAFVAQGYHAAGMDGIAELAGVSKPVLYQHFPGKLELYLAVLDESSDALIDSVRAALESTHDNRRRVRATFAAYFDFVAHDSGSFRLIFESDLTNVPEAASRVQRTNETCAQMIAGVIREDTQLDADTAMVLAMGIFGMAQTSARHWMHSPSAISQEEAARAMSALAWRGISGFPLTAHPASVAAGAAQDAVLDASAAPADDPPSAESGPGGGSAVAPARAPAKTARASAKASPTPSAAARSRSTR
jgi:AcrR family transcriptional regulator